MTPKEQYQKLYPNSVAERFAYAGMKLWRIRVTEVQGYASWETTIGESYTEEQAWAKAWKEVEQEMLDKLAD